MGGAQGTEISSAPAGGQVSSWRSCCDLTSTSESFGELRICSICGPQSSTQGLFEFQQGSVGPSSEAGKWKRSGRLFPVERCWPEGKSRRIEPQGLEAMGMEGLGRWFGMLSNGDAVAPPAENCISNLRIPGKIA